MSGQSASTYLFYSSVSTPHRKSILAKKRAVTVDIEQLPLKQSTGETTPTIAKSPSSHNNLLCHLQYYTRPLNNHKKHYFIRGSAPNALFVTKRVARD